MGGRRLPPLIVLALVTLAVLLAAGGTRSPFPLPDAVQIQYNIHPFDTAVYTVTDRAAAARVTDCLNGLEKTPAEDGASVFDRMTRDYDLTFLTAGGERFSLLVWEEGALELYRDGQWRYRADCGPLCGLLEEIWRARASGELE